MPTGTNDFDAPAPSDPSSPGQNNSMIPGRILMGGGSNSATGRWLWATGFESGLGEIEFSNASYQTIENNWVYQGSNSFKLTTPATINSIERLQKILFPQGKRFGVEFVMAMPLSPVASRETRISIIGQTEGGGRSTGTILIAINAVNDGDLFYENNGLKTLISQIDDYIVDSSSFFHYIKFVFDPWTNKYIRLNFDDVIFELNGISGYATATKTKHIGIDITLKNISGGQPINYIDNLIITADEP